MMSYLTKRRLTSAFLLLLTLVGTRAEEFTVDGIQYSTDSSPEGEVAVAGLENATGEITIPSTVSYEGVEYEVTGIEGCYIQSERVTSIAIPSSITNIRELVFYTCNNLTSITVNEQNAVYSSKDGALYDKNQTVLYCVPRKWAGTEFSVPSSVTSIANFAFAGCTGLTSITIPTSVTTIGNAAFGETSIASIEIPASVTSIGMQAFQYCTSLTSIELPSSLTTIGGFSGCTGLTSITIPSSVTTIGDYAFENCTSLTSIEIPTSVTDIGFRAFSGCTGLTSIEIPNSVTNISNDAFAGCSSLESIKLPSSLTFLDNIFSGCSSLKTIELPSSLIGFNSFAFESCRNLMAINVSEDNPYLSSFDGVLYDKAQTNMIVIPRGLTEITIPPSVGSFSPLYSDSLNLQSIHVSEDHPYFSSIEGVIFNKDQTQLIRRMPKNQPIDKYTIPSSVTTIASNAFRDCTGLTSIEIPNSVTSIDGAFSGCTGLTSIEIPASVTSIDGAFSDCTGLTSIEIPTSVTSIDGAFSGCTGLTSIEIPSSITSIGDWTFSGCTGLTSIEIPSSITCIGDWTFSRCTGLTSIEIPSTVTAIGDYAFNECTSLASVTFEASSSLETIGAQAFYDCNLTTMAIPPSVKEIGSQAFDLYSGSPLKTIVIPHSVESMLDQSSNGMPLGRGQTIIVLNSNDDVIDALNPLFIGIGSRASTCYSTAEILEQIAGSRNRFTLYTVSDARNTGGTLSLSLTDIADEVLQIRALEISGQRVEANESSAYTFEGVGEGTEFELVVHADILDTEYPIYQTITVEKGEVGIGDVKTAGAGLPEVRGNLAEGQAWVRIPGDGGTAEWTLTATDGTTVAQGRAQADGNWQPLEGAQAAKGLYLLTVRCGQTAKTVKFMAQ